MKPSPKKLLWTSAVLLVYVAALIVIWGKYKLVGLSFALIALAVVAIGWAYRLPAASPLPDVVEPPANRPWIQALLGLLGLACAWQASRAGLNGSLQSMAWWLFGSALVWRFNRLEQLPTLSRRVSIFFIGAIVLLGALFRFYKAGAVPVGLVGIDEATFWQHTREFLTGQRWGYDVWSYDGGDGSLSHYLMMIGIKIFGDSIFAFRFEGIVSGVVLTYLIYRLGRETLGPWIGLIAGFFWACSLWPVTVTRGNFLMAETLLVVVSCLAALMVAIRKGGAWRFALAGVLWGFCFNVYTAARIMLVVVPWLFLLLWVTRRDSRNSLIKSTPPLLTGFVVGLGPLLVWLVSSYPSGLHVYSAAVWAGHQGGALASSSLLGRLDEAFSRVIGQFAGNLKFLTHFGYSPSTYFPPDYPFLHPWLFTAAVAGAGVALARFRNGLYAFVLSWWFIGYLPGLAALYGVLPDRRSIMILPPTLLLAALGVETAARTGRAIFAWTRTATVVVALTATAFAALYATYSWRDYFVRNQRDPELMVHGSAPLVEMMRAVHSAVGDKGGIIVSTWRPEVTDWYRPAEFEPFQARYSVMSPRSNTHWLQRWPQTFSFADSMKWAYEKSRPEKEGDTPADVLVLLVPFYDFLEPRLKALGATLEVEVPVPATSDGPMIAWGMKKDLTYVKLYRIRNLEKAAIDRLGGKSGFQFHLRELIPPANWTREEVRALYPLDKRYAPVAANYKASGRDWRFSGAVSFNTDTPWFWQSAGKLPIAIEAPYELRFRAKLNIPEDGEYFFGASASVYTKIKLNEKTVFERDPFDPSKPKPYEKASQGIDIASYEMERYGFLGPSIRLSKGIHVLEINQALLSSGVFYSHILRPLWRRPGGHTETLPLELLEPLP